MTKVRSSFMEVPGNEGKLSKDAKNIRELLSNIECIKYFETIKKAVVGIPTSTILPFSIIIKGGKNK